MFEHHENNVYSSQLKELKIKFEQSILTGNSFEEVKKIYMEIKRIESHLKAKDWSGL